VDGEGVPTHTILCVARKRAQFKKLSIGYKTLGMTTEGLGEMFVGYFADMSANKFPMLSTGRTSKTVKHVQMGARTPICVSGNLSRRFYLEKSLEI
jgi:hypothetical protein